jgi:hypothetical protein
VRIDIHEIGDNSNLFLQLDKGRRDRIVEGRVLWVMEQRVAVDHADTRNLVPSLFQ